MVVNVRRLPAGGLGRLLPSRESRCRPASPTAASPGLDPLAEIKMQLAHLRQQLGSRELKAPTPLADTPLEMPAPDFSPSRPRGRAARAGVGELLECF